jgi:glycosyltransferase involved in cell wall biosynthesis
MGIPATKIRIISNGFDDKIFKPISQNDARQKLGLPLKKKIIISVGSLVEIKGQDILIKSISKVISKVSDVYTVIVGSGPWYQHLKNLTVKLGIDNKVLLVGGKAHEDIPIWLNAADFFVLPSLCEGFPTVLPEAMACGLPIIASDVGGVSEAIEIGTTGYLFKSGDVDHLTSTLLNALNRKWDTSYIIESSKKYNWTNLSKQIMNVYEEVI